MYLWELTLDSIPLAWKEDYEEALVETPNGGYTEPDDVGPGSFYDIPAYKTLLETTFNTLKHEAQLLFSEKMSIQELNRLIEIDICLYSIIWHWICTEFDYSNFNPNSLYTEIRSTATYFSHEFDPEMKKYNQMKFIRLSEPFQLNL